MSIWYAAESSMQLKCRVRIALHVSTANGTPKQVKRIISLNKPNATWVMILPLSNSYSHFVGEIISKYFYYLNGNISN